MRPASMDWPAWIPPREPSIITLRATRARGSGIWPVVKRLKVYDVKISCSLQPSGKAGYAGLFSASGQLLQQLPADQAHNCCRIERLQCTVADKNIRYLCCVLKGNICRVVGRQARSPRGPGAAGGAGFKAGRRARSDRQGHLYNRAFYIWAVRKLNGKNEIPRELILYNLLKN